jgi:hypothetical protein
MKMKNSKVTLLFVLTLFFQSCFIGTDGDSENIVSNYYIAGDYGLKNVHLGFEDKDWGGIGLIGQPITAVGNNEKYIIVKRESDNTEFYILKIIHSGDHSIAEKNIRGPLTEKEFDIEKNELGLKNIEWTKRFNK